MLGSSASSGRAAGSVIRDGDQLHERRDDREDADAEAERCQRPVVTGSGRPQLIPNATGLRHGLMTWPGGVEHRRGVADDAQDRPEVDAEHLEHRARVVVGEALAEHRVHRDQQAHREQDREAAAGRVDAALLVELLDRGLLALTRSPLYLRWSSLISGWSSCIWREETSWRR